MRLLLLGWRREFCSWVSGEEREGSCDRRAGKPLCHAQPVGLFLRFLGRYVTSQTQTRLVGKTGDKVCNRVEEGLFSTPAPTLSQTSVHSGSLGLQSILRGTIPLFWEKGLLTEAWEAGRL